MRRHRFHGDPARFEVVAAFVAERFGRSIRTIADVAGGQGALTRVLCKRYGYDAEVVDPRGWTMRGVAARAEPFDASFADYYDLVVGLHPDSATRSVAEAALARPTILVPCCNFWDRGSRLGRDALLDAIGSWLEDRGVGCERVELGFRPPANRALVTAPPEATDPDR